MRKQYQMAMSAAVLAAGLLWAGTALAQSPDITSFHGNGQLTWTNSNTSLFYRVEWAPSLTPPDAWHSNYVSLIDIRSSGSVVTSSVPMFYRVVASSNQMTFASPVQKTGQATSYRTGDDGALGKGVAWPNLRFTDHGDGTVTDNLTGLMWTKSAYLAGGTRTWNGAIDYCNGMNAGSGTYGYTDWRLPNVRELQSLIDYGRYNPALPSGHPFTSVQTHYYWTSTTSADNAGYAWLVFLRYIGVSADLKTASQQVWPVRGGG